MHWPEFILGWLAGGAFCTIIVLWRTRRCTCLPPDFRESQLDENDPQGKSA